MDNSFFIYLEKLELMIFFSAYPLMYILIRSIGESGIFKKYLDSYPSSASLLPLTYALIGILYLGLQLKELYPDYSVEHIKLSTSQPFLKIWGLLSIAFLLPVLNKRPLLSLLHSLIFFFFILKDLYGYTFSEISRNTVKNDMHIYTYSLFLNLASFIFIIILFLFVRWIKNSKNR